MMDEMTKFKMAVPPPSTADRMLVTTLRMRVMLPLMTTHTDSSTDRNMPMFCLMKSTMPLRLLNCRVTDSL